MAGGLLRNNLSCNEQTSIRVWMLVCLCSPQTQCTGTVRIIAPSHAEEYAVNLLLCPKLNKRILFTYACVGNMVYQTSCGIFDILCIHVFTLPGANFKFIDDVFNKYHINEQW